MAQPQGLERIPLAVGSDFQMPPVRVPERQGAGEWVNAGPPVGIDAPAQPSAPKEAGISDTMSLLGQNIWDAVVYHTPAAMAAAVEGDEPYKTNDWKDWLIQRSRQRSAEMALAGDADARTAIPGVSRGDINSLGPSLGFSAVGAGAGLGAGVPAGIAGNVVAPGVGTAAGYAAGMLASGKAAYNMATNQFIRDLHDSVNEESVRVTGKPVSTQAFAEKQAQLADVIRSYGLWEAVPEAAGNALSFGILTAPVKGAIGKLFGQNIATRMASKLGSLYGGELATETATQMGQHNAEVRAGMTRAPVRSFTSPSDWGQSFKEVAPTTVLQTTLMAGGFKGAHALLNRGRGAGTDDGADAVPGEDLGIGGSGGGGIEGEYIPADQSGPPAGPAGGRGGETFTQAPEPRQFARPPLPAPSPLEGDVLGPEALPAGQALLPQGSIDSTATEVAEPESAPSLRQRATSRGLLTHSKRPSPELLQRLMRVDEPTARLLYNEWAAAQTGPRQQDIATPRAHAGVPPEVQPTEGAKDGQRQTTAEVLSGAGEQSPAITPLEVQAHAAATSPFNARPQPTDAQKEAGNYAKGHVRFQGMDISIENPAGSVRSGVSADGKAWKTQMQHHYGYIRGTVGRDKDHLDVFIKPGAQSARTAYVIDQADPKTGAFDEHKIVFGADSEEDARAVYLSNYEKGWKGLGAMTAMPMDEFKAWLKSGKTKRPIAYKEPKGTVRATTKNDPEPHGQLSFGKVGLAPGIALPVSLKANNDGTATVMRGEEPFYDFDSGDPVKVKAAATPSQVKQAVINAGAVTARDKWFGVSDGETVEKSTFDRGMEKLADDWSADDLRAAAINQTADEWHKAHIEALIGKFRYGDAEAKEARAAKTEWESHQDFLETALENGETIPQRVLDDYVSRGIKPDPEDWPLLAKKLGQQNQEERTAGPVAESQAPAPSEPGEDGVAPIQGGAAPDREKDAKGNPIYKVGDRVEFVSGAYEGRHGAVKEANAVRMVSVMMFSNAPRTEETTYHYVVTTDNGAEFFASPSEIKFETSRPESVVPDISIDGIPQPPQRIYDGIGYAKQSAEKSRAAAQRARKASSIAEHKRYAQTADEKAARYQAAWDAWAKENPAEAEKIAPKPVAKPPGAAPSAGGSAAATVAGGALNVEGLLKGAGLVVTKTTTKNGTPVWNVSGNTREHIEAIKTIGGRWYGPRKVWSFYNDDPSTELAKKLEGKVKPAEPPKLTENEIILPDNPTYIYGKVGDQWHYKAVGAKYEGYAGTIGGDYALKLDAALKAKQSIAGKPTIAMSDASLENLANSTLASPAAQEKARAELAARDQADEVDLGALFDEVLDEEMANASVKEEDSPVTQSHKVTHPDKMVNWWQNELSLSGRRQALNAVGSQAIRADVKWGYLPEKWQKALTEIVGTDKDPMVAEKAGASATAQKARWESYEVTMGADGRYLVREKTQSGYQNLASFKINAYGNSERVDHFFESEQTRAPVRKAIERFVQNQRTAGQAAASAVKNTASGLADAIDGLGKLFGSNGSKLSSGLTFDEETYAKAKPLFASAIAHFKDAGADLKEAMRAVVRLVLEKFGPQVTENMKPYVVRFMEDVRGGKLNYDEGKEGQRNDRGAQVESGKPLAEVSAGEVEGTEGSGPAGGRSDAGGDGGRGGNQGVDGQGRPPGRGRGDRAPAVDLPEADDGRPGRGNKGRTGADGSGVSERDGAGAGELTRAAIPEQNFVITEDVALGSGGQMTKYRDNIAAIKLIKTLQAERRRATPAEQRTLARYVGWGGIPNAFKNPITGEIKPDWKDEVAELESLLTPRELRDASSSTRNAHYTAQSVVDFMWRAAARMGFGGGLVLEPSAGTGNFIGRVPEFLRGNTFVTGIELDSITARIAGALYPRANIVHSGFEKLPIPDSTFDLAIGNPPFGKDILRFAYKPELNRATIHNQFFRASLDAVKPGGLQIMVVSRYLMDAQDTTNRLELAKEARLLGAVRLPGVAFKGNALTEVVTDILFLRRRTATEAGEMQQAIYEKGKPGPKNEPPKLAQARRDRAELLAEAMEWVETGKVKDPAGGSDIPINRYFIDNPQMIAGELNRSGSMRMQNDINVTLRDGETLEQAMDKAMEYLPGLKAVTIADEAIAATEEAHRRLGEAMQLYATGAESGAMRFEDDGSVSKIIERIGEEQESVITKITLNKHTPWSPQLFMGLDGRWFRVEPKLDADGKKVKNGKRNVYERQYYASEADIPAALRLGESRFERIKQLLSIRDLLVKQLTLETTRAPVEQMESNRAELRSEYEAFVAAHGLISEPKNAGVVADMPDEGLLLSLESKYKPEITAAKAARTGMKAAPAKATPSPILSRPVGIPPVRVDHADTISDALALTLSETGRLDVDHIATLRGISRDEAIKELTDGDSPLAYPDPEIGFALTEKNAYLSGNVRRKLEAARGANLAKNEAALQAVQPEPWTSDKVTPKFGGTWIPGAVYADFVSELLATKAHVTFAPLTNTFQVYADDTGAAARQVWGTERYPAPALMTTILNSRRIAVYDQDIEGNATLNQGATDAAMDKRRDILEAFDGWVFKDADRRGMLTKLFNDTYNVRVQRQHDGSHMTFPGKVPDEIISLRRGQINAIWRGIVERFVLYDHAVGAGKTFTGIARAMERRRMGLSKKPMVAVPNHLVKEWLIQSFRLYPGAKVLALGTNDLSAKARRRAFAKIATGDWDLVIVPHSSFKFINVSPETEERFLNQALEDANAALKEAEAESEGGRFKSLGVKAAEAMIASIQRRMDALRARSKDKLVTFEQMGIDDLTIDESHEFKNLGYSSNLEDVRGMGNKVGSSKAMDLYIKTRYLHESNGSIAFMTGTPISNSAAEMYTIMRYLAPDVLSEMGLDHFDAFRLQFVDATTAFEPTDSGSGLKAVTRLGRSWSNMRSLMDAYYSVADVVTNDDIQRWYAEDNPGKRFPLPKVKGGKRKEIVAKPTPTQQRILDQVVAGFNGLDAISDVKERNATRLRLMDRARKVALHAKVVNPQLEDEKGGKLDLAVAQIKRIYDAWTDDKGTQLVFLDRSIPKAKGDSSLIKEYDEAVAARDKALNEQNEADFIAANDRLEKFDSNEIEEMRRAQAGGWNAYQYIKDELVAAGIPPDEIAFIQNYTNEADKEALFGAVRDGSIRILLGSTPRMGAGTNVQERLVALHHIDVTWKPSDIEQREGRIIRQENQLLEKYGIDNFEVEILAYVTERTVDAKFWSLNATKLKMINGIRYYDGQFEMEFEDEDAVGMAEIAALASGDPLLLERFRLTAEVEALYRQKRSHQRRIEAAEDALLTAQRDQEQLPAKIIARQEQSVAAEAALRTADDAARQRTLTMLGNTYHAADADQAQFHLATEIKKQRGDDKNAPISIEINGKEYTTSGGAEEAITLILGDAQPFLAKVGGKPVIRRSDYARAMRAALGDVFKPTDGEIDVGEIFGMPATVEAEIDRWETPWITLRAKLTYGNGQVREIEERRNPRPQRHKSGDIIDITVQGLRPLISDIDKVLEYAANPEYAIQDMRKRIASAEKDIPLLEEQLKDRAFKRAEELAIKQERLREVEQQLKEQADSAGGAQPRDATAPTESRAVMPGAGLGATPMVADALKVVRRFLAEFVGAKALDIRVVANVADIPTQFRPSPYAEGVYHGGLGTVWLITSNMMRDGALNVGRLFQVLAHEVVGHYGLAHMMGEQFKPLLAAVMRSARSKNELNDDIYQPGDADYATVDAVRLRYPGASDTDVAKEVLARMAESRSNRTLFGYVRAKIRQWLRDLARAFGIALDVTTAELNDLVAMASQHLRSGDNLRGGAMASEAVAASSQPSPRAAFLSQKGVAQKPVDVESPEFKRWFGDSKVVEPFDKERWQEGYNIEGMLFGGSRDVSRLRTAAKDATIRQLIPATRQQYNDIRREFGLPEVTDWSKRPDALVQDFKGKPLVVYHGTSGDFSEFELGHGFAQSDAFFFADPKSRRYVEGYLNVGNGDAQNTLPVYLNLQNPMYASAGEETDFANPDYENEVIAKAKALGHDGVVFDYPMYDDRFYAAFKPEQIKSAISNTGEFSSDNPSILESSAAQRDVRYVGVFNGKTFWSGEVDFRDGIINEVHSKATAEAADHHHSFYFSPSAVDRMRDGDSLFFWIDEKTGNVQMNWTEGQHLDAEDEARLRKSILRQIAVSPRDPSILESRATSSGPRSPRDSSRGIIDPIARKVGGELFARITSGVADRLVAFLGAITPEYVKAGVISDYGLEERYLDRQIERVAAENRAGRRVKSLVESLMLLDRAQSRVAYAWLNNRGEEADRLMEELPRDSRETLEEIKRWIAELTVEAVRLGQLDVETAARNFMAYLHRSYAKYDLNTDDKTWKAERARSIRTLGEQYKGRGLKINVDPDRIHSAPGWWDGEMKGKKVIVLRSRERRRVFGKMAYEWGFVAQGSPAPAKYADFVREGVWEIRARKADNAITLWRDFTPEERQSMGELDEAKYAVARTIFMMVHDIEIGRFHEWVAGEYAKTPEEAADEGLNVVEGEEMAGIAPRPYKLDEWARVPTTKVPGTNVFRYGAIAGMIVPGPIWNDIRQTGHGRYDPFGKTYSAIMRGWKLSKTALTPTTHINNVMANFIMADMHDVGGRDIIRAVSMMASAARGDPEAMGLWNRFEDSGATQGMFTTHELRREVLDPLLQQLREEVGMADGEPAVLRAVEILSMAFHGHIAESWGNAKAAIKASLPGRVASRLARKAQDYYQNEDAVFRFATFLKGVDDGFSDIEAGKRARKAFLDYHINAPWINAMRGTFLPFVAFVYRAAPMLAETAARKPWKIAKYMMVFGGLNALAYAMLGGDGDEDKERAYLPDEKAGKLWGMVPKLIRMPWNRSGTDKAGKPISDPVFLDVRRWIPVGDIVDFGQEQTAIPIIPPPLMPGGPAVMGMEFLANRSFFSGRNITLGTDTMTEKVGKVAEHFYKGFAPNIPGLPGTWATKKITDAYSGKTDPLGRAYDIPSAIASGVGLKVAPYPTETLRYNAAMEMRSQRGELNDEARRLRRDYSRGGMDRIDLEDKMKEIAEKKKNVAQGFKRKEAAAAGSDRQ